jgi:two-component system sensor histidine kinase VicK
MVHPDDKLYLIENFDSLQPGQFRDKIKCRVVLPDKKERSVCLSLFATDQDKQRMLTGYLEDITIDAEHENKLNEYSNKKNSILNILSHDLAGPLGSIKNLSALLTRKTKALENQDIDKLIASIERISKKAIHMLQEFVKQEFIESAGVELLINRTDLIQGIDSLMTEYKQSENEMGLTFVFNTTHPQVYAAIDETKFMQAINNLISNAIKFTPDGGTIRLDVAEKEDTILITIADTGIGIPKKFHDHLFDKFNPARRTGLKGEPSVGLGMSIIKTIIEWHRGSIWFESEENIGTTFYIELPKSS